jgi:fatty acid desaturase
MPPPAPEAASISRPSIARWLLAALIDWGIIGLSMAAVYEVFQLTESRGYAPLWDIFLIITAILATFVTGTRQHSIVILGHEGAHGHISSKLWLNDFLAELLVFWPMGIGISGYRRFHFTHHENLGTEKDPELYHKKHLAPHYDLPARVARIIRFFFGDMFLFGGVEEEFFVLSYIAVRDSIKDKLVPVVWWVVALFIIWHFSMWWILLIWFAAMGSAFWAVFRLRIWTEHMGTADVHRIYARFLYRLVFVPHNTWYHFEHHRWTSVPYWNLPKARALNTEVPVRSLEDLFASYKDMPVIPSGTPLR